MKKNLWWSGVILAGLSGCAGMNHTESGALGGGIIGAAAGTVIGGLAGDPLAGAAIGAGTGAIVGGAAGNAEDKRERRQAAAAAAYARAHPPMTVQDVIQLTQARVSPEKIVRQIDSTGSWFNLRTEDLIELQQQGVHDHVVAAMQARRTPPPVYVRPHGEVVIVEPPPVSVGIGFGYYGRRRCW